MQAEVLYAPTTQVYTKMEPAFAECAQSNGDYIIPVAWGSVSKAISCMEHRIGTGQCLGSFHSKDVDTSDQPWGCITEENRVRSVCKAQGIGMGSQMPPSSQSSSPLSAPQSAPANKQQARRLYMSQDVFSPAYLERGAQPSSDPLGWTQGISTLVNLQKQAQQSTILPVESWGSCSSYGNYSSYPNATLTNNRTCGVSGNCVLGERQ